MSAAAYGADLIRDAITSIGDPTPSWEDITPERAAVMLSTNRANRSLKKDRVIQYADDMSAGRWRATGESVKLDHEGDLIDGQNRLAAIIRSGVTIRMLVVRGVDRSAQVAMDSGVMRTTNDALSFAGYGNTSVLAATATTHYLWRRGALPHCMSVGTTRERPSREAHLAYIQDHPELQEAAQFARTIRRFKLPSGAVGAAYIELRRVADDDEASDFFHRADTMMIRGADDPIGTLVRRIADMRARRESIRPALGLYLIVRTWNAIRTGEGLSKLQVIKSGEFLPIPEPR